MSVAIATCAVKPACAKTSSSLAGPAWAPSAAPPACERLPGRHTVALEAYQAGRPDGGCPRAGRRPAARSRGRRRPRPAVTGRGGARRPGHPCRAAHRRSRRRRTARRGARPAPPARSGHAPRARGGSLPPQRAAPRGRPGRCRRRWCREGLGQHQRGGPDATADVEHTGPVAQPLDQTRDGGQPLREQRVRVQRAVVALHRRGEALVVLVPGDALPGGEGAREAVHRGPHRGGELEHARHRDRAVVVGEHCRPLGGQREARGLRVVVEVAGRRLRREPLAQIPLGEPAPLGKLSAGDAAGRGELAPQPETVTEVGQHGIDRHRRVGAEALGELLEDVDVELGRVGGSRSGSPTW
jgi:hypothetical protein